MSTWLEIHNDTYQFSVHTASKDNYLATCTVKKYFDVGITSAMLGKRLFVTIYKDRHRIYAETGIRYLDGYVHANIADTISRMANARGLKYTFGRDFTDESGRDFTWITVDLIGDEA